MSSANDLPPAARQAITHRALPWDHDPSRFGWDGYPISLDHAAEEAVAYARLLLADEIELERGQDEATALMLAACSGPSELRRYLIPSLPPAALRRAMILLERAAA